MLQKAHKLDFGTYLACPRNPAQSPCKGKHAPKAAWEPSKVWDQLGFRPDGHGYYQYEVKLTKAGFWAEARANWAVSLR